MRDQSIDELQLGLTFSADERDEETGKTITVDLITYGRYIAVTDANKEKYIAVMIKHKLQSEISRIVEAFRAGFQEVFPPASLASLSARDLSLLIAGSDRIDLSDWKEHTEVRYDGGTSWTQKRVIHWFWRTIEGMDENERRNVLRFVTGSDCIPFGGFAALRIRFTVIVQQSLPVERLPTASTCFNRLILPVYESFEQLQTKLKYAVAQGTEHFGFC